MSDPTRPIPVGTGILLADLKLAERRGLSEQERLGIVARWWVRHVHPEEADIDTDVWERKAKLDAALENANRTEET